ncbi:glycosyltransferase [Nanohaloarchaea archaeon H01]|nr:glycosyltransferase [Nanohaloarchaea archaeon H01]
MKIAIFVRDMVSPGGAERSMETLKESLEEDHEVELFSVVGGEDEISSFKLPLPYEMKALMTYLESLWKKDIDDFDPDLILTQHELSYLAYRYSKKNDAEMFLFLRDYSMLYNERYWGKYSVDAAANYLLSFVRERFTHRIIDQSSKIIANSDYIGEKYREYYGIETETVYPFVEIEDYKVENTGDKILHVNPTEGKGIRLTLEVAEKMPGEKFIVAGNVKDPEIEERMAKLDNVEHLGYVENMKEVYRQTKIVLMPSKWEEPYGRIPVEAGASGIPTIATDRGGLSESVGVEELLVDYSVDAFMEKIREVEDKYDEYSNMVRENAEERRKEKQVQKIREMIDENGK